MGTPDREGKCGYQESQICRAAIASLGPDHMLGKKSVKICVWGEGSRQQEQPELEPALKTLLEWERGMEATHPDRETAQEWKRPAQTGTGAGDLPPRPRPIREP